MSDTTPRPDDQPVDPTAPFEPATDTETTEVVPEPSFEPVPAPAPPAAGQQPFGQQYDQQQYAQQLPPPPPPGAAGYAVAPAPMKPTDERTAGMAAHGATLAATVLSSGTLGFVCALVMYLVFRDRGPFVRAHAANALNIQIIAGIVILISIPFMLILVGFIPAIAAVVWAIVMHIIGAVKANNGEWWSPPLTPQFVK